MKVLVTGGGGFIGSNVVRELEGIAADVRVVDDFSSGLEENLIGTRCDVRRASVSDRGLGRLFTGLDAVVHLAARTSVLDSMRDPWATFEVNAAGTLNMLIASRAAAVPVFVFASSNAVLGDYEPPLDETKLPQQSRLTARASLLVKPTVTPSGASPACG